MLKLSAQQLEQLSQLEAYAYVDRVHDAIVEQQPEQNTPELRSRLYHAYDYAIALGISDSALLTQFLYFEAAAPLFYKKPPIDAWLHKPGASAEQRWRDMIAVLNAKIAPPPTKEEE